LSKKLKVGENFSLPIETVTSTVVVYGGKGMGKTNFGAVLVEEMASAGLRWCVLDPLGAWWGLRHSANGKGKGIECLILGGAHGDIPIEPTGGAIVADLVVDESANVIIDFSRRPTGQVWSIGEKIRFVTDYTTRLFERQGELVDGRKREPLCQFLDEAARYIPQTIRSGDVAIAKCVSVWETLVEEGRNFGIGVVLLTQRSARMAKSVSEVADAVIAFRIVGPNSIKAITDWLGEHVPKEEIRIIVEKIRKLEIGSALLISPGWLKLEEVVNVRPRQTFDSSATPKPGERARRVSGAGAKPDLAKYAERMAATIERAKENDPKALKAQIAQLKQDLAKRVPATSTSAKPIVDPLMIRKAVAAAVKDRDTQWKSAIASYRAKIGETVGLLKDTAARFSGIPLDVPAFESISGSQKIVETAAPIHVKGGVYTFAGKDAGKVPLMHARPTSTAANASNGTLPAGEKKVLCAIAQYPNGAERDQLSVLTSYKRSSRDAYIQRLREKGFVQVSGNSLIATQEGIDALGNDYEPLPVGEELQQYWLGKLPEGERKILAILLQAGGDPVDRERLSELTDYKRSSRDAYIQRLTARRIVQPIGRGEVQAVKELF
jgi:hypothetical protein